MNIFDLILASFELSIDLCELILASFKWSVGLRKMVLASLKLAYVDLCKLIVASLKLTTDFCQQIWYVDLCEQILTRICFREVSFFTTRGSSCNLGDT